MQPYQISEVEVFDYQIYGGFSVRIYSGFFLFVLRTTSDGIHRPCFSSSQVGRLQSFFCVRFIKKVDFRASFKLSDAILYNGLMQCNVRSKQFLDFELLFLKNFYYGTWVWLSDNHATELAKCQVSPQKSLNDFVLKTAIE